MAEEAVNKRIFEQTETHPWHSLRWESLSVGEMSFGERRFEAENYLTGGHAIRTSIERRRSGWAPLSQYSRIWQPSRLKATLVSRSHGIPFLAATQVFDSRPMPRKWLAAERTPEFQSRFVQPGTILVTRSGAVGRTILSTVAHENIIISDDLLRVVPLDEQHRGWIYAFLRSQSAIAMMVGAKYGHIIKHLEPSHLDRLPVPGLLAESAEEFNDRVTSILRLRSESHVLARRAEDLFSDALGEVPGSSSDGFSVSISDLWSGRRRFEATYHHPDNAEIMERFQAVGRAIETIESVTSRVWWMSRFKRYYGEAGIAYLSADELFTINPSSSKRILVRPDDRHREYFVEPGWIIMACSGQTYGLNGSALLATDRHRNVFFSHDLIRIVPDPASIRTGYLLMTLTHPVLGRSRLVRRAYGTSIPHLDPADVRNFPLVRLSEKIENEIADLVERSASLASTADAEDEQLQHRVEGLITSFLTGHDSGLRIVP